MGIKKRITLFSIILTALNSTGNASIIKDSYDKLCKPKLLVEQKVKPNCSPETESEEKIVDLQSSLPDFIQEKVYLYKIAQDASSNINKSIDEWSDYSRFVKKQSNMPNTVLRYPENLELYQDTLKKQLLAMSELRELETVIKKSDQDLRICRLLDCPERESIKAELSQLKNIKNFMLHDHNIFQTNNPNDLDKVLKNKTARDDLDYLSRSLLDKLIRQTELLASIGSYSVYLENTMYLESPVLVKLPNTLRNNKSLDYIVGLALIKAKNQPDSDHKILCAVAEKKIKLNNEIFYAQITTDIASLVLPSLRALRIVNTARFLPTVSLISKGNLTHSLYFQIKAKEKECLVQNELASVEKESTTLSKVQDCYKESRMLLYLAAASVIPFETLQKMPSIYRQIKGIEAINETTPLVFSSNKGMYSYFKSKVPGIINGEKPAVVFSSNKGHSYSILNLTHANKNPSFDPAEFADSYYDFVGEIYSKRLKLPPEVVKEFIASAKSMKDRTTIISSTRSSKELSNKNKIEGGMSIVYSSKASELLPLEKATGFAVPKDAGKVAELSRLTVDKGSDPELIKHFLSQAANLLLSDETIQKVYYYTSKSHYRLYSKIGGKGKVVNVPQDGQVIVELNRSELKETLESIVM